MAKNEPQKKCTKCDNCYKVAELGVQMRAFGTLCTPATVFGRPLRGCAAFLDGFEA